MTAVDIVRSEIADRRLSPYEMSMDGRSICDIPRRKSLNAGNEIEVGEPVKVAGDPEILNQFSCTSVL